MAKSPTLSRNLSPQFAVQFMLISGGSLSVRFLRSNSPVTVSTIVVSFVITSVNCVYTINIVYNLQCHKPRALVVI